MRLYRRLFMAVSCIFVMIFCGLCCSSGIAAVEDGNNQYVSWLKQRSMLYQARALAREVSGHDIQWQHSYGLPQTKSLVIKSSVWFNAYPSAMITRPHQNILQFLGNKQLWEDFSQIGIQLVHTGPIEISGGIINKTYTPTVDGWFDRISYQIDSQFGSEADYKALVETAKHYGAMVAGDIIPGHTGLGTDFLLAERGYEDYAGIYDMVQIKKQDWTLLPTVKNIWETANLTSEEINQLTKKGYIPGHLQRVMYSVPGAMHPMTGWNASGEIIGVDGKVRRWVYLHYFKPGQPTMNWLDPSYAAQRIVAGDIVKNVVNSGVNVLRIDANPFLGIELKPSSLIAWSEGHPLSVTISDTLASMIRKVGGFSFQELNLDLDAIRNFSKYGPDLSYDFITRPALEDAVLTGDARFLRLMLLLMHRYQINPEGLIHDMQNHDEITYELVHFLDHSSATFQLGHRMMTGKELRQFIVERMHRIAIGKRAPYNRLSGNGLCTTFVGLIATRLGIQNLNYISLQQKEKIKQVHLLMAMFNAMQPGVFSISGWDLVGALPLPASQITSLLKDGDSRWINRGAYDLLGDDQRVKVSASGIPKAVALYGSLTKQLTEPQSFVSQLKDLLNIRKAYGIALSKQIAIPSVKNDGVVLMVHELLNSKGYEITAINFGNTTASEQIDLNKILGSQAKNFSNKKVVNLLSHQTDSTVSIYGLINLSLERLQGKILLIAN